MIKILLFIKHRFAFLWRIIEETNGYLFGFFFSKRIKSVLLPILEQQHHEKYQYRELQQVDLVQLEKFFNSQDEVQYRFFKPHAFDLATLKRLFSNPAFLMMGVFDGNKIIGYFFLRFFLNKKCFIGRIVDKHYQRQGVAKYMNTIMYQTTWKSGFRCLTTISKNNKAIVKLHEDEPGTVILKELPNDYMLVEMLDPKSV